MKGRLSKVGAEHTKWWDTERLCLKCSKALLLPGNQPLFQLSTSTKHLRMMFIADALESSKFPTIMQKRECLWIAITKCRHKKTGTQDTQRQEGKKTKRQAIQSPKSTMQATKGRQTKAGNKKATRRKYKEGQSFKQRGKKKRNTQGLDTGTQETHDEKRKTKDRLTTSKEKRQS